VAAADPANVGPESHRRQVADFVDAVRTGRSPAVTGEDGRRALELILAARESNRSRRPVELATPVHA
jgi:UDP-N-acetyl-2-amino-2-deoxyglucuronate dehydrogenase